MKNTALSEGQLQDAIRLALGSDPLTVWWRNNIGVATMRGHTVRFGVGGPGGSDLIGIVQGRFVALEVKTPTGKQSPEQQLFESLVRSKGGIYLMPRSVDEAVAAVNKLKGQQ